jgi:hypothetical protein
MLSIVRREALRLVHPDPSLSFLPRLRGESGCACRKSFFNKTFRHGVVADAETQTPRKPWAFAAAVNVSRTCGDNRRHRYEFRFFKRDAKDSKKNLLFGRNPAPDSSKKFFGHPRFHAFDGNSEKRIHGRNSQQKNVRRTASVYTSTAISSTPWLSTIFADTVSMPLSVISVWTRDSSHSMWPAAR